MYLFERKHIFSLSSTPGAYANTRIAVANPSVNAAALPLAVSQGKHRRRLRLQDPVINGSYGGIKTRLQEGDDVDV